MTTRTTLLRLLLLLAMCTAAAFAGGGGSVYTRHGIGDLRYGTSGRGTGMGGVGIALLSSGVVDPLNPATWGVDNRTQFSISGFYEGFASSDDRNSTYLSQASFNGLMFAIPLIPRWGVVLGAGITPYSRVDYNIVSPSSQNGYDYTVRYQGDGGLSQGHLGFSAMPDSQLLLGAKMNYYFGTIRNTLDQSFTPAQYTDAEDIRLTRFNGLGATFGIVYRGLKNILNLPAGQTLNIGAVVSTVSRMNSAEERYFTYTTSSLTTRDTVLNPEGTTRLPLAAGGGIAFTAERYSLGADFTYQNWNAYTVNDVKSPDVRDSYRFSAGGELIPKREASAPFFQRLAYRAGFFYDASYYDIKGEPINEIGFTAGIGVPIVSDTRLHFTTGYSFRGTTDQQLQKDRILRFTVTLTAGELWFVRPPEE
ncbi:MAG TPA: hypothetical protein VI215_12475 [Bacteroidota bacterium]